MAVETITMGPGTLVLGPVGTSKSIESQVTNARCTPSVERGDALNVLSGESVAGDRTETWVLAGTIVQDFGNAAGVWQYCFEHRGESLEFVFVPNTAAGRQVSGTVTVEALEVGGDVKSKPSSDFEWQIVGDPVPEAIGA